MSGRARPGRNRRADLSQHFLRDATASRLVRATSISASDLVVEIGPGRGALTKHLAQRAGRLFAVELDHYLAHKLEREVGHRVTIVPADFRAFPLPDDPYSVVGNVPYAITTDIVRKLVEAPNPPRDAWLVVQRELGQRFCGRPHVRESLWSLRLKPVWHLEVLDRLRRTDFDPPPSVESVFLRIRHRGRPILEPEELALYLRIVETAFQGKATVAQALRPWLSKVQVRRLAADLNFTALAQPADLWFEQWLGVLRFVMRLNL